VGLRPAEFHEKPRKPKLPWSGPRARNAGFQRLLKKSGKGKLSRRSTLMNADKAVVLNLRSSVFIGGQL
jgi:hypothetical protein